MKFWIKICNSVFLLLLLFSCPVMSDSLRFHGLQHSRLPCTSPSSGVCPSSCSLQQWCHSAISPSDALFSFNPQSFPTSRTFPMSHLFSSDDQNTGASASASVLPVNIQGCSPKDFQAPSPAPHFKSVFFALCLLYGPALTTVCDHWEDHSLDYMDLCWQNNVCDFLHPV